MNENIISENFLRAFEDDVSNKSWKDGLHKHAELLLKVP